MADNPDAKKRGNRDWDLRRKYGITAAEYDALRVAQNGGCAICGRYPQGTNLCVDHDHETGKVRGLLCANCNRGIGLLGEDLTVLHSAIIYLQRGDQ